MSAVQVAARRRVRRLHVAALLAVPVCLAAGAFELWRALDGNQLSWLYAVEWPLIAGYVVYMWRRLVQEQRHPETGEASAAQRGAASSPAHDGTPPADPQLQAWQDYQARLHAAQPPGGPPAARTD